MISAIGSLRPYTGPIVDDRGMMTTYQTPCRESQAYPVVIGAIIRGERIGPISEARRSNDASDIRLQSPVVSFARWHFQLAHLQRPTLMTGRHVRSLCPNNNQHQNIAITNGLLTAARLAGSSIRSSSAQVEAEAVALLSVISVLNYCRTPPLGLSRSRPPAAPMTRSTTRLHRLYCYC